MKKYLGAKRQPHMVDLFLGFPNYVVLTWNHSNRGGSSKGTLRAARRGSNFSGSLPWGTGTPCGPGMFCNSLACWCLVWNGGKDRSLIPV